MAYRLKQYEGKDVENTLDKARDLSGGDGIVLSSNNVISLDADFLTAFIREIINTPDTIPVSSVEMATTVLEMQPNSNRALVVTVSPANSSAKNVMWTSSNPDVLSFSNTGSLGSQVTTADAAGSASVQIYSKKPKSDTRLEVGATCGGKQAKCDITVYGYVQSPTNISIVGVTAGEYSMDIGQTKVFSVSYIPSDSNTDLEITWSSSNTSVARIDSKTGVLQALGQGIATIQAITANGIKSSFLLTVSEAVVNPQSVSLNKSSLNLTVGDEEALTATVLPSNATDKTLTWISSKPSVVSVDDTGKVVAHSQGSATITVQTSNGKTATCSVNVSAMAIPVESVTIASPLEQLEYGQSCAMSLDVIPNDANYSGLTWIVQPSSSSYFTWNSTIRTLTNKNTTSENVTVSVTAGLISGGSGGYKQSNQIDVVLKPQQIIYATDISLDKETITIESGGSADLVVSVSPDNANNKAIDYEFMTTDAQNYISNVYAIDSKTYRIIAKENTSGIQKQVALKFTAVGSQSVGSVFKTCIIDILPKTLETDNLQLTPTATTIAPYETFNLEVTRKHGSEISTDNVALKYTSSNTSIATVSTVGVVSGVADGECEITVSVESNPSIFAKCGVTVVTPQVESKTKILIGDITVGQEIGDALYGDPNGPGEFMTNAQNVSSILTDAIIQQNIDAGNLKEMNLEDALSTYNDWIDRGEYIKLSFATTKSIPIPTRNTFTYHAILIPKNISDDYLPCWIDGVGAGCSFAFPWPDTYASIVDKTVSFNGETYSMSGYYVDMSGANGGYNLTIVKKNQ